MKPRPGARAAATPPCPPVTRGERHCDACRTETPHTATRGIRTLGRRIIAAAVVLVVALWIYFVLTVGPERLLVLTADILLTVVVGAVIAAIGAGLRVFRVVCDRCGRTTTRLSPPSWTRRIVHERRPSGAPALDAARSNAAGNDPAGDDSAEAPGG